MAPIRIVRRSRRLSQRPPSDELDWITGSSFDLETLQYPEHDPDLPQPPALESYSPAQASSSSVSSPEFHPPIFQTSKKRRDGHIPRPPNAFMLYRSDFWAKHKNDDCVERDHRNISRIAAHCWNVLSEGDRQPYRKRAEQLKHEHSRRHPEYKYCPASRRERLLKKKAKRDSAEEDERCKEVAFLVMQGVQGSQLHDAMTSMDEKFEKRAQRKVEARRRRIRAYDDDEDDREYTEYSYVPVAEPKPKRHPRRIPKKIIDFPTPILKFESLPTPELIISRLTTPVSESPFVPTDEIPPLDLSATPDAKESQVASELKLKQETEDIELQFKDYALVVKTPVKAKESAPMVDAHMLNNLYETNGDYSAPIPYTPTSATAPEHYKPIPGPAEPGVDFTFNFNYDASMYFEKQDFSNIFDEGHVFEPAKIDQLEDEMFSQWVNDVDFI